MTQSKLETRDRRQPNARPGGAGGLHLMRTAWQEQDWTWEKTAESVTRCSLEPVLKLVQTTPRGVSERATVLSGARQCPRDQGQHGGRCLGSPGR